MRYLSIYSFFIFLMLSLGANLNAKSPSTLELNRVVEQQRAILGVLESGKKNVSKSELSKLINVSLKTYKAVLAESPENVNALVGYGELLLAAGQSKNALSMFNQADTLTSNNLFVKDGLVKGNWMLGNERGALSALLDVIDIAPEVAGSHFQLSVFLYDLKESILKKGILSEFRFNWQLRSALTEARRLDPSNARYVQLLEDFEKGKDLKLTQNAKPRAFFKLNNQDVSAIARSAKVPVEQKIASTEQKVKALMESNDNGRVDGGIKELNKELEETRSQLNRVLFGQNEEKEKATKLILDLEAELVNARSALKQNLKTRKSENSVSDDAIKALESSVISLRKKLSMGDRANETVAQKKMNEAYAELDLAREKAKKKITDLERRLVEAQKVRSGSDKSASKESAKLLGELDFYKKEVAKTKASIKESQADYISLKKVTANEIKALEKRVKSLSSKLTNGQKDSERFAKTSQGIIRKLEQSLIDTKKEYDVAIKHFSEKESGFKATLSELKIALDESKKAQSRKFFKKSADAKVSEEQIETLQQQLTKVRMELIQTQTELNRKEKEASAAIRAAKTSAPVTNSLKAAADKLVAPTDVNKIRSLEKEVSRLTAQLSGLSGVNASGAKKTKRMMLELQDAFKKILSLQIRLEQSQKLIDELEVARKAAPQSDPNSINVTGGPDAEREVILLERQLMAMKNELSIANKTLAEKDSGSDTVITDLERSLLRANNKLILSSSRYSELEDDSRQRISSLEASLNIARRIDTQNKDDYTNELLKIEAQLVKNRTSFSAERSQLKRDVELSDKQKVMLEEELAASLQQLERAQLNKRLKEKETAGEIRRVQDNVVRVKKLLDSSNNELSYKKKEIAALNLNLNDVKTRLALNQRAREGELEKATLIIKSLEDELSKEKTRLSKAVDSGKNSQKVLNVKIDGLQKELSASVERVSDIERSKNSQQEVAMNQIKSIQKALEQKETELGRVNDILAKKTNVTEVRIHQLERELAKAQKQFSEVESASSKALSKESSVARSLRAALEKKERDSVQLDKEYQRDRNELKARIKVQTKELGVLRKEIELSAASNSDREVDVMKLIKKLEVELRRSQSKLENSTTGFGEEKAIYLKQVTDLENALEEAQKQMSVERELRKSDASTASRAIQSLEQGLISANELLKQKEKAVFTKEKKYFATRDKLNSDLIKARKELKILKGGGLAKNEELKKTMKELETELISSNKRFASLSKELQAEKSASKNQIDKVRKELSIAKDAVGKLTSGNSGQLDAAKTVIKALQSQLIASKKDLNKVNALLKSESKVLGEKVKSLEMSLLDSKKRIGALGVEKLLVQEQTTLLVETLERELFVSKKALEAEMQVQKGLLANERLLKKDFSDLQKTFEEESSGKLNQIKASELSISKLQAEIAKLGKLASKGKLVEKKQKEVTGLKKPLVKAREDIQELSALYEKRLKDKGFEYSRKVGLMETEVSLVTQQLKQAAEKKEAEVHTYRRQIAQLNAELEKAKKLATKTEDKKSLKSKERRIDELESELEVAQTDLRKIMSLHDKETKKNNKITSAQIHGLEVELKNAKSGLTVLIEEKSERLKARESKITELQEKIVSLSKKRNLFTRKKDAAEIEGLKGKVSDLMAEKERLTNEGLGQRKSSLVEIASLEAKLSEAHAKNISGEKKLVKLVEDKTKDLNAREAEITELQKAIKALSEKKNLFTKKKDAVELAKLKKQVTVLQAEKAELMKTHSSQAEASRNQIASLGSKLSDAHEKSIRGESKLVKLVEDKTKDLNAREAEITELQKAIKALSEKKNLFTKKKDAVELAKLKKQVTVLQAEKAELMKTHSSQAEESKDKIASLKKALNDSKISSLTRDENKEMLNKAGSHIMEMGMDLTKTRLAFQQLRETSIAKEKSLTEEVRKLEANLEVAHNKLEDALEVLDEDEGAYSSRVKSLQSELSKTKKAFNKINKGKIKESNESLNLIRDLETELVETKEEIKLIESTARKEILLVNKEKKDVIEIAKGNIQSLEKTIKQLEIENESFKATESGQPVEALRRSISKLSAQVEEKKSIEKKLSQLERESLDYSKKKVNLEDKVKQLTMSSTKQLEAINGLKERLNLSGSLDSPVKRGGGMGKSKMLNLVKTLEKEFADNLKRFKAKERDYIKKKKESDLKSKKLELEIAEVNKVRNDLERELKTQGLEKGKLSELVNSLKKELLESDEDLKDLSKKGKARLVKELAGLRRKLKASNQSLGEQLVAINEKDRETNALVASLEKHIASLVKEGNKLKARSGNGESEYKRKVASLESDLEKALLASNKSKLRHKSEMEKASKVVKTLESEFAKSKKNSSQPLEKENLKLRNDISAMKKALSSKEHAFDVKGNEYKGIIEKLEDRLGKEISERDRFKKLLVKAEKVTNAEIEELKKELTHLIIEKDDGEKKQLLITRKLTSETEQLEKALAETISKLDSSNKTHLEDLAKKAREVELLKEALEKTSRRLVDVEASGKVRALKKELASARKDADEARSTLAKSSKRLAAEILELKKGLSLADGEIGKLEAALVLKDRSLGGSVKNLEESLAQAINEKKQLEGEISSQREKRLNSVTDLEKNLSELRVEVDVREKLYLKKEDGLREEIFLLKKEFSQSKLDLDKVTKVSSSQDVKTSKLISDLEKELLGAKKNESELQVRLSDEQQKKKLVVSKLESALSKKQLELIARNKVAKVDAQKLTELEKELVDKNDRLKKTLSAQKNEKVVHKKSLAEIEGELQSTLADLSDKNLTINQAKKNEVVSEKKLESLTKELGDLNKVLVRNSTSASKVESILTQKISELELLVEGLNKELSGSKATISKVRSKDVNKISELEKELAQLEIKAGGGARTVIQTKKLKARLSELESDLIKSSKELKKVQQILSKTESSKNNIIIGLEKDLKRLKDKGGSRGENSQTSKNDVSELENKISRLEMENRKANAIIKSLEKEVLAKRAILKEDSGSSRDKSARRLDSALEALALAEEQNIENKKRFDRRRGELDGEIAVLNKRLKSAKGMKSNGSDSEGSSNGDSIALAQQLDLAQSKLSSVMDTLDEQEAASKKQVSFLKKDLSRLQKELSRKNKNDVALEASEAKVKQLTKALAEAKMNSAQEGGRSEDDIARISNELDDVREELALVKKAARDEIAILNSENNKDVSLSQVAIENLGKENETLRMELSIIKKGKKRLEERLNSSAGAGVSSVSKLSSSESQDLRAELEDATTAVMKMQIALQQSNDKLNVLEIENAELGDPRRLAASKDGSGGQRAKDVNMLEKALHDAQGAIVDLNETVRRRDQMIAGLETTLEGALSKEGGFGSQNKTKLFKDLRNRVKVAEDGFVSAKRGIRSKDNELQTMRTELQRSFKEIMSLQMGLEKSNILIKDLTDSDTPRSTASSGNVKQLQSQLVAADKTIDALKRQLSDASARINSMSVAPNLNKSGSEPDEAEVRSIIADLDSKLVEVNGQLVTTINELSKAKKVLVTKYEENELAQLKIADQAIALREVTSLRNQVADLRVNKRLSGSEGNRSDESQLDALRGDLEKSRSTIANLQRAFEAENKKVVSLEVELSQAISNIDSGSSKDMSNLEAQLVNIRGLNRNNELALASSEKQLQATSSVLVVSQMNFKKVNDRAISLENQLLAFKNAPSQVDLENSIKRLEKENGLLVSDFENIKNLYQKNLAQVLQLQKNLGAANQQVAYYSEQLANQASSSAKKTANQASSASLQQSYQQRELENDQLQKDIAQLKEVNQALQRTIVSSRPVRQEVPRQKALASSTNFELPSSNSSVRDQKRTGVTASTVNRSQPPTSNRRSGGVSIVSFQAKTSNNTPVHYSEFFVLDNSIETILENAGIVIPANRRIGSYSQLWIESLRNGFSYPGVAAKIRRVLRDSSVTRARTDGAGRFSIGEIPSGDYFFIGATTIGGRGTVWSQQVALARGRNNVVLDAQNAALSE